MLITTLAALFILGLIIFVHELGHFLVAKRSGIRILKFSLGFGPKLIGVKRGETEYAISLLPFGGYVKPAGENPEDPDLTGAPWEFLSRPWWIRLLVFIAGPLMNLFLAIFLNTLVGMVGLRIPDFPPLVGRVKEGSFSQELGFKEGDEILSLDGTLIQSWHQLLERGKDATFVSLKRDDEEVRLKLWKKEKEIWFEGLEPTIPPVIGSVAVGMPAYQRGLMAEDRILAVDGVSVNRWSEVSDLIHKHPNQKIELKIKRGEKILLISVVTISQNIPGLGNVGLIGIRPPQSRYYTVRLNPVSSLIQSSTSTLGAIGATYVGIWKIISHPVLFRQAVGGPLMIAQMTGAEAKAGLDRFISFAALLSVIVAVFNLLPIPVLDGGHAFFCLVEGVRRKPLSIKNQILLQRIGLTILTILVLFTFFNDVLRIMEREKAILRHR